MNNLSLTACSIWIREKNPGKNNTVNIVNLNKKIKSEDTVLSDIQNLKAMYMIDDTEEQKYDYEIPESYGMEENAERKRGQNQII